MSDWTKIGAAAFGMYGHRLNGVVFLEGEIWWGRGYIDGQEVYREEWSSREDAINNVSGALSRACFRRRFDQDAPTMPGGDDLDCEDDDDD